MKNYLNQDIKNTLVLTKEKKNQFLTNYNISKSIKTLFLNKGMLCNEPQVLKQNSLYSFHLPIFYRTKTLLRYRKKIKLSKNYQKNTPFQNYTNRLLKSKNLQIFTKFFCLNRLIDKKFIRQDYDFLKQYKNLLFVRNYNLWLDLIKTTNLLSLKKINVESYLYLLSSLFRYLNKRKHNRFILFISNLFEHILKIYPSHVKGLKLIISGRLQSKPRSSIVKIEKGTLNLTSKKSNLLSSQMHVYTLYGAFGLKLYINYQK